MTPNQRCRQGLAISQIVGEALILKLVQTLKLILWSATCSDTSLLYCLATVAATQSDVIQIVATLDDATCNYDKHCYLCICLAVMHICLSLSPISTLALVVGS